MDARDGYVPMGSPERCERTELIKSQCAHCRPPEPMFLEALFDAPDDAGTVTFPAGFAGRCEECDGFFDTGDMICRTADGTYICDECAP